MQWVNGGNAKFATMRPRQTGNDDSNQFGDYDFLKMISSYFSPIDNRFKLMADFHSGHYREWEFSASDDVTDRVMSSIDRAYQTCCMRSAYTSVVHVTVGKL
jgi:hypothetical protein